MKNNNTLITKKSIVIIAANTAWSIVNFRVKLIESLTHDGYKVIAVAPEDEYIEMIPCDFIPITIDRMGTNPFKDILFLFKLNMIYKRINPFVVLHFTTKVNIYGALASSKLKAYCINNISGLGSAFIGGGFVALIQQTLYRLTLRYANVVFFQNVDDAKYFYQKKLAQPGQSYLLPGSGVDINKIGRAHV